MGIGWPTDDPSEIPPAGVRPSRGLSAVMNGVTAPQQVLAAAGYGSIVAAVAAHRLFLHSDAVAQTDLGRSC